MLSNSELELAATEADRSRAREIMDDLQRIGCLNIHCTDDAISLRVGVHHHPRARRSSSRRDGKGKAVLQIEINIAARKAAETVFSLAVTEVPAEGEQRYWETLARLVAAKLPKPEADPRTQPMTDEQVTHFGNGITMPFGKHTGKRIADVPLDYLIWLVEQPDAFKNELRRYIGNDRIKAEIRLLPEREDDRLEVLG